MKKLFIFKSSGDESMDFPAGTVIGFPVKNEDGDDVVRLITDTGIQLGEYHSDYCFGKGYWENSNIMTLISEVNLSHFS